MRFNMTFDPLLPWSLTVVLAIILVGVLALLILRRIPSSGWRILVCALLLAALFNPVLQREEHDRLPGTVALIIDESASQQFGARSEQTEAAVQDIRTRIDALGGFTIREIRARDNAEGNGTTLFSELSRAVDDVPPEQLAGAIFVTDGIVHDVPDNPDSVSVGAPIHALITGREDEVDRRIVLHRAPRFAILNEPQTIDYRVIDPSLPAGTRLAVTLRVDGEQISTEMVSVGETATIDLPIDHAGPTIVELEVEAGDDELTLANNVAVTQIDVVREHLRVLLVSGEPHAGERTWRNVLKSDASVDLVHFTILRPPEKQDGTPINELSLIAFPTRELFSEKIDEFDLIIFDRYQRRGVLPILYFDNIARYVREGGAVLLAAGPDYAGGRSLFATPLGSILPAIPTGAVLEEPYRAAISETGSRHPVTRNLPGSDFTPPAWSRWFRLVEADTVNGTVTMNGPGERPLLVLSREGDGRVALLLSDHAWLWARGFEGGGPHGALLRRLVHWLMQEPELEEEALRARAEGRDLIVDRQTLAERPAQITITDPTGQSSTVELRESEPGLWQATIENAMLGLHRVTDGERTALAHIGPANPIEYQEVVSTAERLAPIAEATGGAAVRLTSGATLTNVPRISAVSARAPSAGNGWIGLRRSQATVLVSIDRLPLFSGLLGLALLIGGFTALWFREGR